ncbi:MAG: macro domain-containing protein [Promethearchaeota archaeon]|nr:MAG: macro domain-containing protein [Candidatus Lokiarchaeota archaeon]
MKKVIKNVILECSQGNIVKQLDIDTIVNAANAELRTGGGVAGAIHRAAGPELEKECLPLAPIKPGEAVITGAYNLPNEHVIHTLGPVYGRDKPEDKILANCYRNSLKLADKHNIESIAFPAISTGVFGYPVKDAAEVAFETIINTIPELKNVNLIRFVLFGESNFKIHAKILKKKTE